MKKPLLMTRLGKMAGSEVSELRLRPNAKSGKLDGTNRTNGTNEAGACVIKANQTKSNLCGGAQWLVVRGECQSKPVKPSQNQGLAGARPSRMVKPNQGKSNQI